MTAVFADSGFFSFALSFCFYYFMIFAINQSQIGVFGSENLINREARPLFRRTIMGVIEY